MIKQEARAERIKRLEAEIEDGRIALENNTSLQGSERLAERYRQSHKLYALCVERLVMSNLEESK